MTPARYVSPSEIPTVWPFVQRFIQSAVIRGGGDYSLGHVYKQLRENKSTLWLLWDDDEKKLLGAITLEVCDLIGNGKKICVITAFGSVSLERTKGYLKQLHQYARDCGCEAVRLYGRPGWIKALRDEGYEQPWVALEKTL